MSTQLPAIDLAIIPEVIKEARRIAAEATRQYLDEFGEHFPCGFARIYIRNIKLSTKLGKALAAQGFERAYEGNSIELYNPSGNPTQSMDAKEFGAAKAADYIQRRLGITVGVRTRLD